jgi:hypothetical protein
MTLKQAVRKLGGPNRASNIYNAAFKGKRDSLGDLIERLPRSTLETWVNKTSKTKATDAIRRILDLAKRSTASHDALLKREKRSRNGKVKAQAKAETEARHVA